MQFLVFLLNIFYSFGIVYKKNVIRFNSIQVDGVRTYSFVFITDKNDESNNRLNR